MREKQVKQRRVRERPVHNTESERETYQTTEIERETIHRTENESEATEIEREKHSETNTKWPREIKGHVCMLYTNIRKQHHFKERIFCEID